MDRRNGWERSAPDDDPCLFNCNEKRPYWLPPHGPHVCAACHALDRMAVGGWTPECDRMAAWIAERAATRVA